jgi:hypothetical protein
MMKTRPATDKRIHCLLPGLLSLLLCMPAMAEVRAHLDRDRVYVGDPVTLVIESSGASSGDPDLSPLKKDFRVLGTATSTQFSFINGRTSNRTTWTVQLGPLQLGRLRIPPIQVGAEQTAALELEVTEVPEQITAQQSEHLFLEAEVDIGDHAYVQQQIPYTLRFYSDDTVVSGELRAPQPKDALIRQLGNDRHYNVTRNKRQYRVTERRYMISPEKSGELQIPPATFSGQLRTAQTMPGGVPQSGMMQRFFRNAPFAGGKPVRAHSKAITIDVRPRPAAAGSHWLPAEGIELHDSWTQDPPQLRTGEPVSRTISIRATGLSDTQIPELQLEPPEQTRVYPETPVNDSHTDGDKVYALSRQTFTYIPGRAGELTIPAVELPWWNTRSDEQAIARLPQWVVKVAAGSGAPASARNQASMPERQPRTTTQGSRDEPRQIDGAGDEGFEMRAWHWLAFVVLGLAVVLLLARKRLAGAIAAKSSAARQTAPQPSTRAPDTAGLMSQLQTACAANDARAAALALLELGRARWPDDPPNSLGELAQRLGDGRETVMALDRALYAADTSTWDGARLWRLVSESWHKHASPPKQAAEGLAPLYPRHN